MAILYGDDDLICRRRLGILRMMIFCKKFSSAIGINIISEGVHTHILTNFVYCSGFVVEKRFYYICPFLLAAQGYSRRPDMTFFREGQQQNV